MPFLVALTIHLHLPDNGSLKGKRKELLSVRAALTRRFGAARRGGRRPGSLAAGDARRRRSSALGGGARARRRRHRALSGRALPGRRSRVERRLVSFEDIDA